MLKNNFEIEKIVEEFSVAHFFSSVPSDSGLNCSNWDKLFNLNIESDDLIKAGFVPTSNHENKNVNTLQEEVENFYDEIFYLLDLINKSSKRVQQSKQNEILVDVDYQSIWDGDTEVITSAKLNLLTGKICDIQSTEINGLDLLDTESIIVKHNNMVCMYDVFDDNGSYHISKEDLNKIRISNLLNPISKKELILRSKDFLPQMWSHYCKTFDMDSNCKDFKVIIEGEGNE